MARNLTETACLGPGDLGGQQVVAYRYRTQVAMTAEGAWWGGLYTAYIDPATNRLVRLDSAQRIASWAPEPSSDIEVTTVVQDPGLRIAIPD